MKKLILFSALVGCTIVTKAQNLLKAEEKPLVISGSVDTYYKYDFSGYRNAAGGSNIPTSFASDQNSFSIGMVDIAVKKKVNKAAFVGEISFGPRGQAQSIPNNADGQSYHIQNLYVSYDLTDKLNVTGGYMATFLGYEVISPAGNFNYSTSYLFTNGPFQNAGVKATYAFSGKASLMAGIFNDTWNYYQSSGRINTFGAQLMVSPVDGWTAYVNLLTGPLSGTIVDLTTNYQITQAFKLGLNGATFTASDEVGGGGFEGVALYPQLAVSKTLALGVRAEYFRTKNGGLQPVGPVAGESVTAFTLTANVKAGPLTLIPEVRLDNGSTSQFIKNNGGNTKTAAQALLAAVYAF